MVGVGNSPSPALLRAKKGLRGKLVDAGSDGAWSGASAAAGWAALGVDADVAGGADTGDALAGRGLGVDCEAEGSQSGEGEEFHAWEPSVALGVGGDGWRR